MDAWGVPNSIHILLGIAAVAIFFCFVWIGRLSLKLKKLNQTFTRIYNGSAIENESGAIERLLDRLEQMEEATLALKEKIRAMEETIRKRKGNVGIVRFNAFENEGSDLSFSIAVIDDEETGFVLTSIYGRDESRVYAKPLTKGRSMYHLTHEEKEAILEAKKVL